MTQVEISQVGSCPDPAQGLVVRVSATEGALGAQVAMMVNSPTLKAGEPWFTRGLSS